MYGVGLLGGGSQADEVASYLGDRELLFNAVTSEFLRDGLVDIANPEPSHVDAEVIAAVGAPALRRRLVQGWPGKNYSRVFAQGSYVDERANIGLGAVVAPGVIVSSGVNLGMHALLNIGATLSHGVRAGDYLTVGPGVHIGGDVFLGDGVVIGIGACITHRVTIASGVVVGAGAVVIRDVDEPNSVVVGNPSRVLRINGGWADAL